METVDITVMLTIVGGLTCLTNIITEVLKNLFKRLPPQITATVVALALTGAAGLAYACINGVTVEWYMIVGNIVLGFAVSYAAQFGFDKLKEIVEKYR